MFGVKRGDPRTAGRDPRLARDPRLRSTAATAAAAPSPPQTAKLQGKQKPPPAVSTGTSVPEKATVVVSQAKPVTNTKQSSVKNMQDPRTKAKVVSHNKAVVPPVRKEQEPSKEKKTGEQKKVEKVDLTLSDDDSSTNKGKVKEDSQGSRSREGSRDGSRSPRGGKPSKVEKRKDSESRSRNDRPSGRRSINEGE